MAKLYLTPAALRDMENIWQYTAERWGLAQAERYTDRLTNCFETLAQSPLSGTSCSHIRPGYRRQSVESHVVYYRAEPEAVTVVRILHERMDAPRHI
jgi:toxin ParE1/3/4